MMSLIALPPIFIATRDGLQAVPAHMREAAFALGKTRIATIRRVLLPSVRSNIATGVTLGVSRIIGDTAIVVVLLGETLRIEPQGAVPVLGLLHGTGSTLTSYVYDNSPAGEGAAPQKAYAAAFVLLLFVLGAQPARRTDRPRPAARHRPVGGGRGRLRPRPSRERLKADPQHANLSISVKMDSQLMGSTDAF